MRAIGIDNSVGREPVDPDGPSVDPVDLDVDVPLRAASATRAWSESASRIAAKAYRTAHGEAIADTRKGLRWRIDGTAARSVGVALLLLGLGWWVFNSAGTGVAIPEPSGAGVPLTALPAQSGLPTLIDAATDPDTVVVHVAGEVTVPGIVELPTGSRVADAVVAAGGLTDDADSDSVNLARVAADGEQIYVPAVGETAGGAAAAGGAGPAGSGAAGAGPGNQGAIVDLNTATTDQLDALPGIGPVLAGRIVADRTANGPFSSPSDLDRVTGIGQALLGGLEGLVTT